MIEAASNCVAIYSDNNQSNKGRRRRAVALAALATAGVAFSRPAAAAQNFFWDPAPSTHSASGGGSGQWDSASINWFNGTNDAAWDSAAADATTAVFGGTAGTVNIVSPTTVGPTTLNATGLTFNTTGYTLNSSTAGNTLFLQSDPSTPGMAPTINVVGSNTTATIGGFVSGGAGPNNLVLGGTQGLAVNGGGTLFLANALTLTGGITVNSSTLSEGLPGIAAGNASFTYLNNNSLTLNNGTFVVNSTNSPSGTAQLIGNVTISGNSTIKMSRGNTPASSSITFATNGQLIMQPNSTLNFSMGGNTSTNGAVMAFTSTVLNGDATFIDYENATTNADGTVFVGTNAPVGENGRLGTYTDNGHNATFLSGGSSALAGTSIQMSSAGPITASGNWTLGSSSAANPQGVELDLKTTATHSGAITTGVITVNNFSQLALDGAGLIETGSSSQTISISGIGTVTPANASTSTTGGALSMINSTTGAIGNILDSNVNMVAASSINLGPSTINEINGNIIGVGPLTIVGGGTLNLGSTLATGGTGNNWSGGTIINNGSVIVNSSALLGASGGPLTLASSSITSPTNTSITFNAGLTIGTLSASFAASSGTAHNNIVLNSGNFNIIQTGSGGTFGPGTVAGLTSTISGAGSISLDAASNAVLNLTGPNTYTGGTTINGGTLAVNNTTGSATGTGAVSVGSAGTLSGSGKISNTVTVNGGTLTPGGVGNPGTLTLGGLTFANSASLSGTLDFDLNTTASSDQIALGTGNLTLGNTANTIPINIINLGTFGAGTYHLITFSGSLAGGIIGSLFVNPATAPAGFNISAPQLGTGSIDLVVTTTAPLTWAGGSGSWDTVAHNWTGASTVFQTNDNVLFDDTTPGTAPFAVTIPVGGVAPGLVTFNNNLKNYTISGGPITGNATLVAQGTGQVTLKSQNTFTGAVAVDGGGILTIDADNELGNSVNNVSLTSASTSQLSTLQVTSTFITGRSVSLFSAGGAIDITGGNTLTVGGTVKGAGGLTVNLATNANPGTLVLTNAANVYAGATTVNGGTLQLGAAGAIPSSTALTVVAGARFDTQTFSNQVGSIAGAGAILVGNGATLTGGSDNTNTTFTGTITGAGALAKLGSGTLTLPGSGNSFAGGFTVSGGGTVIAGTGGVGNGLVTLGTGSTLKLTSANFVFGGSGPTLGVGVGGGNLIAPAGATIALPTVAGANPLTISGGGVVVTSTSTIPGGTDNITLGTTGASADGGDTLVIGATDANGNIGITNSAGGTGGTITLQPGSTFYQNATLTSSKFGIQIGFKAPASSSPANTLGIPASLVAGGGVATGNNTLTLNNNTTWEASGFNAYSAGSPTVAPAANITVNVPNAGDTLIDNTAWRAGNTTDFTSAINVTGNGLYQITSGAITTTMYAGAWNINMGPTGMFVVGNIAGGTGEALNALGYETSSALGWNGLTNPITLNGGTILFGADGINPGDSTPPQRLNSFRSNLTITGPSAIASTGFEYSSSTTGATGAIFDNTPVTANISANVDLGSTLTVDTYDPQNPTGGPRSLNFNNTTGSTTSLVQGNFTWEPNSTLIVDPGTGAVKGGNVSFGRTSGTVLVNSGATLQVNQGSTANIGFIPGVTGVAGGSISGIDPLTDGTGITNLSVAVIDNGAIAWGGRTALAGDAGTGIKTYQVGGLTIGSGATAVLNSADTHTDRTVLVTPPIVFSSSSSGSLQINDNDMIVLGGGGSPATTLASVVGPVLAGRGASGSWNGTSGIISAAAAAKPSTTAIAVEINDSVGDGSGAAVFTTFDGVSVNHNDVLVKYTFYGDADLSGKVDATDYGLIDSAFTIDSTTPGALIGWRNGDFNYDGVVNGDDYTLIDNAFNTQGSVSFAGVSAGPAEMIAGNTSEAAVPEPGSVGVLIVGAAGLLSRRRRRA